MSTIFRASMVGKLMTSPEKDSLPAGAITILDEMISQNLLNWRNEPDFLTMKKGRECENESIDLYNEQRDTFYLKNVERITIRNLTGECDILDESESLVIDIKTSYNKKSHPINLKASKLYEWQLRAYMYLYNVDNAELAYCLVDTPNEFRKKFEPDHWHEMHDVPEKLKISTVRFSRNLEKEQQLLNRLDLSSRYVKEALNIGV